MSHALHNRSTDGSAGFHLSLSFSFSDDLTAGVGVSYDPLSHSRHNGEEGRLSRSWNKNWTASLPGQQWYVQDTERFTLKKAAPHSAIRASDLGLFLLYSAYKWKSDVYNCNTHTCAHTHAANITCLFLNLTKQPYGTVYSLYSALRLNVHCEHLR